MVPNTLNIFRKLYEYLPPLVPPDVQADMGTALEQLEGNPHLTIEELEQTMIGFGKKIWPYRKAFHEIFDSYDGTVGETQLINLLPRHLKQVYGEFMTHGGTYRDVLAGGATQLFEVEDRPTLTAAIITVRSAVYQHARQAAVTTDRDRYVQKIEEFRHVQDEIEAVFDQLHTIADAEQEHPELASEIRAHIRGFEYGLAALGPDIQHEEVLASVEYFAERKKYKNIRLGA